MLDDINSSIRLASSSLSPHCMFLVGPGFLQDSWQEWCAFSMFWVDSPWFLSSKTCFSWYTCITESNCSSVTVLLRDFGRCVCNTHPKPHRAGSASVCAGIQCHWLHQVILGCQVDSLTVTAPQSISAPRARSFPSEGAFSSAILPPSLLAHSGPAHEAAAAAEARLL